MKLLRILLLLIILKSGFVSNLPAQQNKYIIHFPTNKAELSQAAKETISNAIISLNATGEIISVKATGHTDNHGSDQFNENLSRSRALGVSAFLVELGLGNNIITIDYRGEKEPVAENSTETERELNRRVELIFEIKPKPVEAPSPAQPQGDINQLYELACSKPQEFCIDTERDTLLVGRQGTIIYYKANTIDKSKIHCRCFTLSLNEYFDNSDLVLNNLTTTSEGRLLESGGMVKLDGYCDGQKYTLGENEFFTVMVPADTILPGMKLLSANRVKDADYLDWKLDDKNASLDNFDYTRMIMNCRGTGAVSNKKCHVFFCRIIDFVRGVFSERQYKNKDQKNNEAIENEQALMNKYELKGESLETALLKSKEASGKESLKYYVYKNYSWDYRNIDRYKPGTDFITFSVHQNPSAETDVKIIYKNSKTVVPSFEKNNSYVFKNIASNIPVWVVGIRYSQNKQIFLAIEDINTSEKKTTLNFEPVNLQELKDSLKKINK